MEQNQLNIDLEKQEFDFSTISNLNEITSIRFDNYTNKIKIPLLINEYPNITELYFSGKSRDTLYETPDNLEQFIHIKHLTLWSCCNFSQMKPMFHLEKLDVVVQNTESDTRKIADLFPNLICIEIWGGHLKNQKLPDEIGNLLLLESLHLVSCGLNDLPHSFVNLKRLKKLYLRGLPMDVFPEEITQLKDLEVLEISQPLIKLPDSLSHLTQLKKLNLHSALNGANMDVAGSFLDKKVYLKPIPDVIGKLNNLEDLNLGICGVFDITPILPLKKLRKLNLQYSALKDCDGFSNFTLLEELNLATSYDLENVDGLIDLPLKKLNLYRSRCESIAVISSLVSLQELNIDSDYIEDFSPIYNHPEIKILEADSEIQKKWHKKEKYNKLPAVDLLISQLKTAELTQFEETILNLSKHVEANYSEENNPLAGYFGIETEDEEITEIEVLDTAIQEHLKNLSDKILITIFDMTFKSVGFDNYNAALIVLEEIILRKNLKTQQQVIKKFYKACEYYDAGHRFWSYTVHDQLIDDLFGQFTSEALYKLLKKASIDMLNSKSGDQMEELFIPAFENTTDLKLQKKLLNVLFKYEDEARTYYGKKYFDGLFERIKNSVSPELVQLILAKKEKNKEQEKWLELLENLNEENLPDAIIQFVNQKPENFNGENFYEITAAAKKIVLPETSLEILLNFIIEKQEKNYLGDLLMTKYHTNSPEKIIDFLKIQLNKESLEIAEVFNILKNIITDLTGLNTPFAELKIYEDFIVSDCKVSYDKVYNLEINKLLNIFFQYDSYRSDKDISWVLEKTKTIIDKTNEPEYKELRYNTYLLMDSGEYKRVKEAFDVLYPKIKEIKDQGVLFYNIIAAIKLNDGPYFDLLYNEVQQLQKITEVLLAFNLACAFAHFGRKEKMLFYIKESIRLGKMKQQFLDDTDFEKYWQDTDFLGVIEEK